MSKELVLLLLIFCFVACSEKNKQLSQNPSPMEEHIRAHKRVDGFGCEGTRFKLEDVFSVPIEVYIPGHLTKNDTVALVFHFHGSSKVTEWAACDGKKKYVVATVNLGSGSAKYEKPLLDPKVVDDMFNQAQHVLFKEYGFSVKKRFITSFSAGYGAVRALLSNPVSFEKIDGVLLLDGLHTDYIPDKQLLSNGGKLNEDKLQPFLQFARKAVTGNKRFVFTHSSIFPGTYASTTECADYLINELGLKRTSVLEEGPLGMQQVGNTNQERLHIIAFAGNTAPDHVDHLHGLSDFIQLLDN
ncbi:hypothetical protein [Reichenbachiella sp. MALMAid0571]|uniref:hypothetical protein n=1 Tax=Reichenbachiella sp. MALMAid0571 TaxID=3143939 RepID=UPI0032DF0B0A